MSTGTETGPAEAQHISAKILRFPTPVAATPEAAVVGGSVATAPSAFQRLAAVRRRRGVRTAERATTTELPAAAIGTRPTIPQLVTWLLNLRKGGVGYLYWNAARLPIEVALVRAARLDEGAIVDVVGHKLLVVEPLRPRLETPEEVLP
ncbi:MAG: hypothetical protein ACR2NO_09470 [Chloroflexota bacterium]